MISVVIPAYNEKECIAGAINHILKEAGSNTPIEIIVSDGGSTDGTMEVSEKAGAQAVQSPRKGRSAQMNYGASIAKGSILYFLHADTLPPTGFLKDIQNHCRKGNHAGSFMLDFDYKHWFLRVNCWFTRFDCNYFRFGDHSMFVTKDVFIKAGGFCEEHIVMEDQEIIKRIRKLTPFTIIRKPVLTSARKYLLNGIYKTQGVFFLIFFMYQLGYSQQKLVSTYRKLFLQDKV